MTTEREKCEKLYGPYPSQIPIPFLDKEHTQTPTAPKVLNAKSWREVVDYPDHRDVGTPDEWFPRDGRLIRLTGTHPFNCEPPVAELYRHQFITPSSLHYVRNHGACPKLTWEDHTLTCSFGYKSNGDASGDADAESAFGSKKETFTMDDLADTSVFPQRSLPVTLVSASNRCKEQNMIRQTIGFNWGALGVSTNVYTGVLCKDLFAKLGFTYETLEEAGVDIEDYHVEFIGHEYLPNKLGPGPFEEAPWPKQVKYGTSLPLSRVLNPAYDVMVAYEANGQPLQPDHGFPLRLVVPGYIGGRMIKWITQINILKHETYNHYHYHDNRILPPHITAKKSLAEGWWYRPEYIFNELNINSATCAPDHNELLCLKTNLNKKYNVSGYAYTGGGRKISRVEISTNEGVNWQVANLNRTEKPTKYGMHWCWIWWNFEIGVSELVTSKEIWVRAWDESSNVQPLNLTWNLMGMGTNQAFRIKIHIVNHETRGPCLTFEHPTQAGQTEGGWMTKSAYKPISAGYGVLLDQACPEPTTASNL